MQGLPFEIPESLQPYIGQFESDPEAGIANLKAHIKKRGMDAVGFSLLAWLCQESGNQEDALKYALKAKVCAPGSPFIEYLHYFLIHPNRFDAWKPFRNDLSKKDPVTPVSKKHYNLDLDLLIEQLSKAEKKKIELSEEEALKEDKGNNEAPSQSIEDIASETLAAIYEKQKRYEEALDMYGKLLKTKPENTERYQQKISDLKTLIDSEATDTEDPS